MRTLDAPDAAGDPPRPPAPSRVHRFGIEEEFVFLDPATMKPEPVGAAALAEARAAGFPGATSEFLASQIEFATGIEHDGAEAILDLRDFRRAIARIAAGLGVIAAATGAPFEADAAPAVSADERYGRIGDDIGAMVDDHQVCGMHVHLGVDRPSDRLIVLNGLRAWMPLLIALTGNSPFWHGVDTGFASWRTIVMRRWPTTGIPAPFTDLHDYERRIAELEGFGITRDRALVAWMLRISHHLPTVELRCADTQLTADDSVAVALLARRIARGSLRQGLLAVGHHDGFSTELIDAATWEAARLGRDARIPDPLRGGVAPVERVLASALEMSDDDDGCVEAVSALLQRGTGAERQRSAYAAHGVEGVRACVAASVD
ncbi:YbdK family carboxylate-amine ligase [Agromyces sp. NPDC058110]|uniref:carboxylate-amine ligase n=1 Tax=Agromyces sp. NPDC058110 TaxID=3346345 RepID=UPI0036DB6F04